MALITKVGGPTNTNTLQMTNRKANGEQVENIGQLLAPVQAEAPKSDYLSSLDKVLPMERQSTTPSLSPLPFNENLPDAMGAPVN